MSDDLFAPRDALIAKLKAKVKRLRLELTRADVRIDNSRWHVTGTNIREDQP